MTKKVAIILSILILLFLSNVGQAAYVNDLLKAPTAYIMPQRGVVSGEIFDGKKRVEAIVLYSGVEVGGEAIFNDDNHSDLFFMAEIPLAAEEGNLPAVSMGLKEKDLYLVASKKLFYNTQVHVGYGNDQLGGLFVGVNKIINPVAVEISEGEEVTVSPTLPPMNLMAEYVNKKINLGLQVGMGRNVSFKFGFMDLKEIQAGLSVAF